MFCRKKPNKKKKPQQLMMPPPPPSPDSSFFYSNATQLDSIDDELFFDRVYARYPKLSSIDDIDDAELKAAMIQFLSDEAFVDELIGYFRLTPYDFFKLVCQRWGMMFRGMYLRKIQNLVLKCGYMGAD